MTFLVKNITLPQSGEKTEMNGLCEIVEMCLSTSAGYSVSCEGRRFGIFHGSKDKCFWLHCAWYKTGNVQDTFILPSILGLSTQGHTGLSTGG